MSKIDEKFLVKLQGKEFVTYEGLLDLAHQNGLTAISTELIQIPSKENDFLAIVKATAITKDGHRFDGIGDADNKSVGGFIAVHKIRMAETRAKARALRDLTNIGMTAMEELTSPGDVEDDGNKKTSGKASNSNSFKCSKCNVVITQGIKEFSIKEYGNALCRNCQKDSTKVK